MTRSVDPGVVALYQIVYHLVGLETTTSARIPRTLVQFSVGCLRALYILVLPFVAPVTYLPGTGWPLINLGLLTLTNCLCFSR